MKVSSMAENLIGSEIIKLAGVIQAKIAAGEHIYNFTIGDFDPAVFPIPEAFKAEVFKAYDEGHTNYPPAQGMASLRKSLSDFIKAAQGLDYDYEDILVSGGGRPLIYALYTTLIDPGDLVVYPVPSWNNNHYCHLSGAKGVPVFTSAETNFMPNAEDFRPYMENATMLALCSPLNPTGTVFTKEDLSVICQAVITENKRRGEGEKPLYVLYDQMYQSLCYGDTLNPDPVTLFPEMRDYTIFIDGISKSFAATGIRVGWAFGPRAVMAKMRAILSHVGAWSPKPEQVATARYLSNYELCSAFLESYKSQIHQVLRILFEGLTDLKSKGYPVDVIEPKSAIYLTVKIDARGMQVPSGHTILTTEDTWTYLLDEAKVALVPFSAFGDKPDSPWYRLSVGTCTPQIARDALKALESALSKLTVA